MEGQEILQRAMTLKEQSEESENQLNFVMQQIRELLEFSKILEELEKNKEKEILAPLGKGVYAKADRKDEKLFVEVGVGVVVRKTPKETKKVIEDQLKKFSEARIQLTAQLEVFKEEFRYMLEQVERLKKKRSN